MTKGRWKVYTKKSKQHVFYAGTKNYDYSLCGLTVYYHNLYVSGKREQCKKCLRALEAA